MKTLLSLVLLWAAAAVMMWPVAASEEEAPAEGTPRESDQIDVLKEVLEVNSDKYAAPPTSFRKGHVTVRTLDSKAIQKTGNGFTVQLPSGAPVATPAVHRGKVYVSGGFHSKEYYCFKADTGEVVWAINLDDDGPSSAACEDGVIIFNTESCTIFAVDAETGRMLWSYWLGDPLMSTPTVSNGRVYTSYPAGGAALMQQAVPNQAPIQQAPGAGKQRPPASHALACFELKTGKILWQKWIDSDVMSAPVAVDKELYATTFAGTVYRFDQATGKIMSAKRSRATSAPVVVGGKVFYTQRADDGRSGQAEESMVGLDRKSGKQKYEVNRKVADYLDQKVQGASELMEQGMALDAANGFAGGAPASANAQAALANIGQTNVSTLQAFQGSRVLAFGDRNFNCMGDEVFCTDPATGKTVWKFKLEGDLKKLGGFLAAPPVAAGDQVFLGTLRGEVLQIDPASGKVVKTYQTGSPIRYQPVVDGGRIYVGTQDGRLVCVDTGKKEFTGWSMWGGNAARTGIQEAVQ